MLQNTFGITLVTCAVDFAGWVAPSTIWLIDTAARIDRR